MIDSEVLVINELEKSEEVSSIVGDKIFRLIVPDSYSDKYPYIRVAEISNINNNYSDNKAIASDIEVQIDFWTNDDPASLQNAINNTMKSLSFKRMGVTSFYEENTSAVRKSLRYVTKIRRNK